MKILQLCSKPPLPLLDGGCIAMHNISTGLIQANIDLKILTVATEKHPFDSNAYDKDFISKSKIESVFINTKVTITGALTSIFKRDSYNISRFYSKKFELRLIDILQENNFDIVQLESLYMSPYIKTIRQFSSAKIALRAHNIEHTIWSQLATDTINPIKKIYLKLLAKKLKSYEINTFQIVDAILPISNEDEQQIKKNSAHISTKTIPFGINTKEYTFSELKLGKPIKLFHLGALNWKPNLNAVEFFIEKIWPQIFHLPVQMHLAGRNIPNSISNNATENFIIHGDVPNAVSFMQTNDIMLVPLKAGSGMRIKIIEAMALGKIVISTQIGAEGIKYENGQNILIADSAQQFVNQVKFCLDNPQSMSEISQNARKTVEEYYSNDAIIEKLISFYKAIIEGANEQIAE